MIGKVTRGTNAGRLLHYLFGPGRANEHTDPHLVAGFCDLAYLELERRPEGSHNLRRLTGLLAQPLAILFGPSYEKPVWHCSVRAAPEDRLLSDKEWAEVAAGVMDRTGLAPKDDDFGVRWVAVRHAPDHIHIVATLARLDRTRPKIWNDFYKVRAACQEAERRFGLRATARADRTAAKRPSRAEKEQAARRGWQEPSRVTLRREVCTAAAGARTEQEFFMRLEQAGVLVRKRYSTINPGQVIGYAVGLPHHTAKDGGVVWYSGGKLAADLTLPKLRHRWDPPGDARAERAGTFRFSGADRDALFGHAAWQAATAADHIRHCSVGDPAAAADAAWATADTLHVAARVLRDPTLRRAADAYDRACRSPYGRIPRRTGAGNQLRNAARIMALTGSGAGDPGRASVALIANLVALAEAVAELRKAQQHAAQAAAARIAAEHLHTAVSRAHSRVPRDSETKTSRRARPRTAADLARLDFPHGLSAARPVAPDPHQVRPSRPYGPAPPKRAGPAR